MPRIKVEEDMQQQSIGGKFGFSGVRVEKLGASAYTLATIMVDDTGSVDNFAPQLKLMIQTAIKACKKSPMSENILARVCLFNSIHGVQELHGFKPVTEIDPDTLYPDLSPSGGTPLYDATYSAVGATNAYGKQLKDADYGVNAIMFVITDGDENSSTATVKMIASEVARMKKAEEVESFVSVLIGINEPKNPNQRVVKFLADFHRDAEFTHFIDAGDATPGKLAKLGGFISQSISSQSQALGTGGPSQNIQASI